MFDTFTHCISSCFSEIYSIFNYLYTFIVLTLLFHVRSTRSHKFRLPISCHENSFLIGGYQIFIGECLSNVRTQHVLLALALSSIAGLISGYKSSFIQTFPATSDTSIKPGINTTISKQSIYSKLSAAL